LQTKSIMQISLLIVQTVINVDVHLAVHYLMQKSHTIASTPTIAHLHIIAYDTTY